MCPNAGPNPAKEDHAVKTGTTPGPAAAGASAARRSDTA